MEDGFRGTGRTTRALCGLKEGQYYVFHSVGARDAGIHLCRKHNFRWKADRMRVVTSVRELEFCRGVLPAMVVFDHAWQENVNAECVAWVLAYRRGEMVRMAGPFAVNLLSGNRDRGTDS